MSFLSELVAFDSRKKFWLLPILVMAVIFGGLILLTQGTAVAPFDLRAVLRRRCASSAFWRSITTAPQHSLVVDGDIVAAAQEERFTLFLKGHADQEAEEGRRR